MDNGQLTFISGGGMFCLGEIKRAFDLFVFSEFKAQDQAMVPKTLLTAALSLVYSTADK